MSTSSQCSDVTTDFDEEPEEARKEGQESNLPSSFIGEEEEEEEEEEEGGYDDIEEEEGEMEGEKVEEKSVTWKRNDDNDDDDTTLDGKAMYMYSMYYCIFICSLNCPSPSLFQFSRH